MNTQEVQYEGHDLDVLSNMPNYYAWIMASLAPLVRGHVLEYGAGIGTVSDLLLPLADRLTLVEPSASLVPALRTHFASNAKVQVSGEMLEAHAPAMATNSVDTIVMINVLEHIEDDRAALGHLMRILKPGGHLFVFVPALQALMSKIDLLHGHFRRYHKGDLTGKVSAAGGDVISNRYFDVVGVFSWLVVNKWMGSTTFDPRLIAINDRFIVPVSRTIERVISPPFGKNLILVAKKPMAQSR
jgi:SAM-dependent methyltransferase